MQQFSYLQLFGFIKNVNFCNIYQEKTKVINMPPELHQIGKLLIFVGIFILILGFVFLFGDKIPFIGRLPGDIIIKKKNFTFYFPIVTSIILSLIISFILFLLKK